MTRIFTIFLCKWFPNTVIYVLIKIIFIVAQLADKALIATSQQQYLTAMEKAERAEPVAPDGQPAEEMTPAEPKRGFWSWLFNR